MLYQVGHRYPDCTCLATADPPPALRADATNEDHEPKRPIDFDDERDFDDQGPLTDMDMDEDAKMLVILFKHMPFCIDAAEKRVLHHLDFNADEVDHDVHERLISKSLTCASERKVMDIRTTLL